MCSNRVPYDIGIQDQKIAFSAPHTDSRTLCFSNAETVNSGPILTPERLNCRRLPTSTTAARGTADQPYSPSLNSISTHDNEEASSGGLGARSARNAKRDRARRQSRNSAVTPFNTVEIRVDDSPLEFSGPHAKCLRASSCDSGPLRGDSVRPCRDDGFRAPFRLTLFVGM